MSDKDSLSIVLEIIKSRQSTQRQVSVDPNALVFALVIVLIIYVIHKEKHISHEPSIPVKIKYKYVPQPTYDLAKEPFYNLEKYGF